MLTPKDFFIMTDTDRPLIHNIVALTLKGFCYLDRCKKRYDGMMLKKVVSLEDLGFCGNSYKIYNGVVCEFVKMDKNDLWQDALIFAIFIPWSFYKKISKQ